jgi:uncharacterized protein
LEKLTIIIITILSFYSISFLVYGSGIIIKAYAQSDLQTVKYRNLVIDLGNGLKTKAQLTLPAVGKGPFPGVLLIVGTGFHDMNETIGFIHINNKTGEKIIQQLHFSKYHNTYLKEDLHYLDMTKED